MRTIDEWTFVRMAADPGSRVEGKLRDAIRHLETAIARHERHLGGTETTSEKSQRQMAKEMKDAQEALREAVEMLGS